MKWWTLMKIDHVLKKIAMSSFVVSICLTGVTLSAEDKIPEKRLPVSDGFKFPETQQEVDVYEVGRFDFDNDGSPEQIVITFGGGSGGAIWYIARLNEEKISEEIQGTLAVLKSKQGFPDLRIERKCGATERILELYRYAGLQYKCVHREIHNYLNNSVKIEK